MVTVFFTSPLRATTSDEESLQLAMTSAAGVRDDEVTNFYLNCTREKFQHEQRKLWGAQDGNMTDHNWTWKVKMKVVRNNVSSSIEEPEYVQEKLKENLSGELATYDLDHIEATSIDVESILSSPSSPPSFQPPSLLPTSRPTVVQSLAPSRSPTVMPSSVLSLEPTPNATLVCPHLQSQMEIHGCNCTPAMPTGMPGNLSRENNTELQNLRKKNKALRKKNKALRKKNTDLFIGIVILSSLVIILLLICMYFRHQLKALERSRQQNVRPLKEEAETKREETKETELGSKQSASSTEMLHQPFQVDMNKVEPDEVGIILNKVTDDEGYCSCDEGGSIDSNI